MKGNDTELLAAESNAHARENLMDILAIDNDDMAEPDPIGTADPAAGNPAISEPGQMGLSIQTRSDALSSFSASSSTVVGDLVTSETLSDESPSDPAVETEALPALRRELEVSQLAISEARRKTEMAIAGLQSAIDTYMPRIGQTHLEEAQEAIARWIEAENNLKSVAHRAVERLNTELQVRPDLDSEIAVRSQIADEPITPNHMDGMLEVIDQILNYDHACQSVLAELDRVHDRTSTLAEELTTWLDGDLDEEDRVPGQNPELHEKHLRALKGMLEEAKGQYFKTQNKLLYMKELRLNRIASLAQSLREQDLTPTPQIGNGLSLTDIQPKLLSRLSGHDAKEVEQRLVDLLNEQTMTARASVVNELASDLMRSWRHDLVSELIAHLALQRRDVEALLVLIAVNQTHPRDEMLNLNRPTVDGLIRAIGQLSDKAAPFELVNLLAPDFLNGWSSTDATAQTRLCMLFLASHHAGAQKLPSGFLWQLPNEWPQEAMPSWATLWRSALLEEPRLSIQDNPQNDVAVRLQQARSEAELLMARDGGTYVHLRSLRSKRHVAMLNKHLFPFMADKLAHLQRIEQSLSANLGMPTLRKLERMVAEMEKGFSDKELIDRYEASVSDEGIYDDDSFHRRTSLRVLQDCAEGLLNYGRVLIEYENQRALGLPQVTRGALEQELTVIGEVTAMEQAVLEQLCQPDLPVQKERDDAVCRALAQRKILAELLTSAVYALRMPYTAGYLTGASLEWDKILDPLLHDLSSVADPETVAGILLDQEAANQVLLLTIHGVSLAKQKQAQQLMDHKARAVSDAQTEMLRLGATVDDLDTDRQLGRWRFVEQQLSKQLAALRDARERERRANQQKATQLRRIINGLDEKVFNMADTVPTEAYRLIERGLGFAREGTNSSHLLPVVEGYLDELKYRIDHDSWSLGDLQSSVEQLEGAVSGETRLTHTALASDKVLELLEHEDLRGLGLSSTSLLPSEIGTRTDTLRNWIRVRSLPTAVSDDLGSADRSTIQALYHSFAQMVVMRYYRRSRERPIVAEYPSVYSWYELQYPKAEALQSYCVLLALPGNPPTAHDIKHVEGLIDDKKWLEEGFVLLFVPGCTPKIANRFRSHFHGQRLVILSEAEMLSIVLAEADSKTPLGRLRAMMLNVHGAAEVDVYKINQPVDARTAIFVGRDSLVDRIALSGNNYAIYGGRRIGKSSLLKAVEKRLESKGAKTIYFSFEGHNDYSDDAIATNLGELLRTRALVYDLSVTTVDDFQLGIQTHLERNADVIIALLLDEIDRYVESNQSRHVLIETLRALSDRFTNRFRVIIAGFMNLYDCMRGRSPYTPTSDPWRRMLNDIGPLPNLKSNQAERIVTEGFLDILGWKFENRAIPQWIVERTGGHPAFVQCFCERLQRRASNRSDQVIRMNDVEAVFEDRDPEHSFIAYVKYTLEMNLQDPITRFVVLLLASESSGARGFTLDQTRELAQLSRTPIPEAHLQRSLETLVVNSVIRETKPQVFEFTVPDYPLILERLGQAHMDLTKLELEITAYLEGANGRGR